MYARIFRSACIIIYFFFVELLVILERIRFIRKFVQNLGIKKKKRFRERRLIKRSEEKKCIQFQWLYYGCRRLADDQTYSLTEYLKVCVLLPKCVQYYIYLFTQYCGVVWMLFLLKRFQFSPNRTDFLNTVLSYIVRYIKYSKINVLKTL